MKQYTKEELEKIVNDVFKGNQSWEVFDVNIIKHTSSELLFEATHMYDWYEEFNKPNSTHLKAFSEVFNTDNIDVYDEIRRGGCETCDYGSSYGFALRVWE